MLILEPRITTTLSDDGQRARSLTMLPLALALALAFGAAGCSGAAPSEAPTPTASESASTPTTPPTPSGPASLDTVDLGELEWLVHPGANVPETRSVPLEAGTATVDGIVYTLGEPVLLDLTGDGVVDAAAPITAEDGNGIEEQWYAWVAAEDGPEQVLLPLAMQSRCGTGILSVAATDAGLEVHEVRRGPTDAQPCSEQGTDERVRTIVVEPVGPNGIWWPVQVGPIGGFGGVCPAPAEPDGYTWTGPMHAAPDASLPDITGGAEISIHSLDAWPIYGEDFPGWVLVGIRIDDTLGCAWSEAP